MVAPSSASLWVALGAVVSVDTGIFALLFGIVGMVGTIVGVAVAWGRVTTKLDAQQQSSEKLDASLEKFGAELALLRGQLVSYEILEVKLESVEKQIGSHDTRIGSLESWARRAPPPGFGGDGGGPRGGRADPRGEPR